MAAQALSGIAKDLTKMSAKSAIKVVVPAGEDGALFRWVARLTGSKNALKGLGFFMGGALLGELGFVGSLTVMAAGLFAVLIGTVVALPSGLGKAKSKVKFTTLFSKSSAVNWLRRHACFYSPRATSGSWSGCRSSSLRISTGRSGRWAGSAPRGSSATASCRQSCRRFFAR
jgi:hypothetical protein